ncbi:uncharacterized protein BT62DRAFT_930579 [Guyanagaster necrorhizus]|uniref:Uncharacterized protein n=1 Tax=Guyanagaster necrorhizus TaxID=856835 RepID=A0A9P8AU12_9AGAR|nr:uncharacterized protein BT62DRAFT_930579 [Guyanagaster necrorhizus MCA 3950]KAG7447561.1 hypothetical protein BT62DRAFT_930579 [Guyanagaster necrorhizus MCA 3950]
MPCLGSARLPLRSLHFSFSSSIAAPTRWPPHRAFSIMAHFRNDLFDYTSGRWIINDALRHAERRRVFNVDGLCRLAAQSVDRSPDDLVGRANTPHYTLPSGIYPLRIYRITVLACRRDMPPLLCPSSIESCRRTLHSFLLATRFDNII